jgi:hypothetical protein
MVPFFFRLEGHRTSFGTSSLRCARRRVVLSLGVIGLAVVLGAGASRVDDEVDIAFTVFTPPITSAKAIVPEIGFSRSEVRNSAFR